MTGEQVWLVVVTWNGRADTLELLDSLAGVPATTVVVDNGSVDGTVAAVRDRHPDVVVVENHANLGYAGGNNVGIDLAIGSGARWVGVLNNDTRVEQGFLPPLLAELRRRPGTVAVSPDIRYAHDPHTSWFRGARLDPVTASPVHLTPDEQPDPALGAFSTELLSGCCVVAPAEVWRRVGTFDEGMFLIFEDSDWSLRARRCGVDLRVVPSSRIEHKVSRSFHGASARLGTYYFARNGIVFARRHLGVRAAARFTRTRVVRPVLRATVRERTLAPVVMASLGVLGAVTGRRGRAGPLVAAVARHVTTRSGPAAEPTADGGARVDFSRRNGSSTNR